MILFWDNNKKNPSKDGRRTDKNNSQTSNLGKSKTKKVTIYKDKHYISLQSIYFHHFNETQE